MFLSRSWAKAFVVCLEGVSCVFDHIWGGHPDGFQPLQGAMYIYICWLV